MRYGDTYLLVPRKFHEYKNSNTNNSHFKDMLIFVGDFVVFTFFFYDTWIKRANEHILG